MPPVAAKAFLSYARSDNDRENGRIIRLKGLIENEFQTLTGESIEIFTDQVEILWGQDFRSRLNQALQETTFFIPVLTPTYFTRDECRNEFSQFVTSAEELGLNQLLLSIRYIPVADMREDSLDQLKAIAARMQFTPWDQLRLLDEDSPPYRQAINHLATRLVQLTQNLEGAEPGSSPVEPRAGGLLGEASGEANRTGNAQTDEPPVTTASGTDLDEEAPGLIDLVVDVEPAMQAWASSITGFSPAIARFNSVINAGTARMNDANNLPNAFAVKIRIARELAQEAEQPLQEIEQLSKEYSAGLLRLDPAIRAAIELAQRQESDEADTAIENIRHLVSVSREAMRSISSAADAARANAGLSKDLRPILRRFETALRNVADGQRLMDEWESLVDAA